MRLFAEVSPPPTSYRLSSSSRALLSGDILIRRLRSLAASPGEFTPLQSGAGRAFQPRRPDNQAPGKSVFALLGCVPRQHAAEATAKGVGRTDAVPSKADEKTDDPLRAQAERLVSSAIISATSMFVPAVDQHPLLKPVKPESWDFFVTVAGVFIAASRLQNLHLSDNRKQH